MTIGEKFKKMRALRGMTQSELCGERLTRNMLSRIEHDAALPSIDTLKYLALRLDIDPGYFISDKDDPLPFIKLGVIDGIYDALERGDHEGALAYASLFSDPDRELCFIFFKALMISGKELFIDGKFKSAEERFAKAEEYALRSSLADSLSQAARYYRSLCRNRTPESFSDQTVPDGKGLLGDIYERATYELIIRLFDLNRADCAAQIFDAAKLTRSDYRKHINAKLSIASGNFSRARSLLTEIAFDEESKEGLSFRYSVCTDLEYCCKALGDFEGAYKCVLAKSGILSKTEK